MRAFSTVLKTLLLITLTLNAATCREKPKPEDRVQFAPGDPQAIARKNIVEILLRLLGSNVLKWDPEQKRFVHTDTAEETRAFLELQPFYYMFDLFQIENWCNDLASSVLYDAQGNVLPPEALQSKKAELKAKLAELLAYMGGDFAAEPPRLYPDPFIKESSARLLLSPTQANTQVLRDQNRLRLFSIIPAIDLLIYAEKNIPQELLEGLDHYHQFKELLEEFSDLLNEVKPQNEMELFVPKILDQAKKLEPAATGIIKEFWEKNVANENFSKLLADYFDQGIIKNERIRNTAIRRAKEIALINDSKFEGGSNLNEAITTVSTIDHLNNKIREFMQGMHMTHETIRASARDILVVPDDEERSHLFCASVRSTYIIARNQLYDTGQTQPDYESIFNMNDAKLLSTYTLSIENENPRVVPDAGPADAATPSQDAGN